MGRSQALELAKAVQRSGVEGAAIEVKAAHGGLPRRIRETLSAFANQAGGGVVILGLAEEQGFAVIGVANPQRQLAELSDVASQMIPPLRLTPAVAELEDRYVIVFEVPERGFRDKPCCSGPSGVNTGSYIRIGNTNRRMTDYEIFTYVTSRGQPRYDREPVPSASLDDLAQDAVVQYLERLRRQQARRWRRMRLGDLSYAEQLLALDLVAPTNGGLCPTLAGLVAFGVWPQQPLPSLAITFVRYPGAEPGTRGSRGERFLDNRRFEGPLEEMVEEAVQRVVANMRHGTLVEGVLHRTVLEYPEEAVREAIANAVAHRDYSPRAVGSQIRIEMYTDRLVVSSGHYPKNLYQ